MPKVVYETITNFPPAAATVVTVCVFLMLAAMAIWFACKVIIAAYEKWCAIYLSILEAETKLAEVKSRTDAEAVNIWIRDYYAEKDLRAKANRQAEQERYNKRQIAKGKEYMERRKTA